MPKTSTGGPGKVGSAGSTGNKKTKVSNPAKGGKTANGKGNANGGSGNQLSASAKYNLVQQPTFAPRIQNFGTPFGSIGELQRGHMAWDPNSPWPSPYGDIKANGKQTWARAPKVFFLFNPSVVAASYSAADGSIAASLIYPNASTPAVLRVPLQQQVSFTIMFDRTYEICSRGNNSDVGQIGVEVDIAAIKQFTGMFTDVYGTTSGAGLGGPSNNPFTPTTSQSQSLTGSTSTATSMGNVNQSFSLTGINQGVMQVTLCYVYFGAPDSGLRYYGYIDSWDVQYTHFNYHMIPMRAVVDISFSLLPVPQPGSGGNTPPAGAAATAATRLINASTGTSQAPGTTNAGGRG